MYIERLDVPMSKAKFEEAGAKVRIINMAIPQTGNYMFVFCTFKRKDRKNVVDALRRLDQLYMVACGQSYTDFKEEANMILHGAFEEEDKFQPFRNSF